MEQEYGLGASTLTLRMGSIAESRAEVLVSSDDVALTMGGGVSEALRRAAGESVFHEARKVTPARLGDVVVTGAGSLTAKYIFHAVTLDWQRPQVPREALVRHAVRKAMGLLPLLGCRSIAFPSIGSGLAAIPIETVAAEMIEAIAGALLDTDVPYAAELWFFDASQPDLIAKHQALFVQHLKMTLGLRSAEPKGATSLLPPSELYPEVITADGYANGYRARAAYEMLRRLDARRADLEGQLIEALTSDESHGAEALGRCRRELDELRQLRQGYETDLLRLTGQGASPDLRPNDTVFLSSTYVDLKAHREAVTDVINRLSFNFLGMEGFAPSSVAPAIYIRQQVERAGLYFGIVGMRYGYVDAGTGRSMTELEYEQALASGKPLLIFVMDKGAPITVDMVETDPDSYGKLLAFRNRVLQSHMCRMFTTPEDLVQKADSALRSVKS